MPYHPYNTDGEDPEQQVAQRAASLPTGPFTGSATVVLKEHSSPLLGLLFESINRLRDISDRAKDRRDLEIEAFCTGRLATQITKVLEFTVAKKVDVGVAISNQDQIPRWDDIPIEQQAEFLSRIQQAGLPVPTTPKQLKPPA